MGGTYWYYVRAHSADVPHVSIFSLRISQYVLDGDVEYHDPVQPSTNLCPLLPSQMVNVLDVPVQGKMLFEAGRNVSSSSLDSAVFTLDPKDKYLSPGVRRATTTSAIHGAKTRFPAMIRSNLRAPRNISIRTEVAPQTSKTTQVQPILQRQRSLRSIFHRMRQTRSAGSNTNSTLVWPRKIFSRASQLPRQHIPDPLLDVARLHRAPSLPPTRIGDEFEMPTQIPSTAGNTHRASTALKVNPAGLENNASLSEQLSYSDDSKSALVNEKGQGVDDGHATSSARNPKNLLLSSYDAGPEQLRDSISHFTPTPAEDMNDTISSENPNGLNLAPDALETFTNHIKMPFDKQTNNSNAAPSMETLGSLDFHSPNYGYAESLASYATSANFSPCLASNTTHSGPMSPCHLSQPETPIMSEFGDEFLPPLRDPESLAQMGRSTSSDLDLLLARPSSRTGPPQVPRPQQGDTDVTPRGFQGYSLPNHDHASVLTIRKPPSITFKNTDGTSTFPQNGSKQDLVHSWNDGSEHRMTALADFVEDLSYLRDLIN